MRQARQASAGPSSRRGEANASRRRPARQALNDVPIIDLTDSEDEHSASQRPRKRQRIGYVDLTEFDPAPSRSVRRAAPADPHGDAGPAYAINNVVDPSERYEPRLPTQMDNIVDRNQIAASAEPTREETPSNLEDSFLSQVLEVVPDVLPEHAISLVRMNIETHGSDAANNVVHILLEDPSYPKVEKTSKKRKRDADDGDAAKLNVKVVDYSRVDREKKGGHKYDAMALVWRCVLSISLVLKDILGSAYG